MPHINYYHDFTVTAFIVNAGRVLLVNHPRYNKWIPVGGHIEHDEDPEAALFREIKEETGLRDICVLSSRPDVESEGTKFLLAPNYMDVHEANPPHKHISLTYFVIAEDDKFTLSDEHDDMKWFTLNELQNPKYSLSNSVIFYATQAISTADGSLYHVEAKHRRSDIYFSADDE